MSLDAALVTHCRAMGIVVREGCALEAISGNSVDDVGVVLEGTGEERWEWVVAADGMWSPTRRALGLAPEGYLGEWHAFRQYVSNVTGPAASELFVWFDADLLPGYAWSFPLPGNRANVGFGMLRDDARPTREMAAVWRDILARPHVRAALGDDFEPEGRHTAWPIPARIDSAVRSSGRVLFVGDAVCATDLLTGEGIGQALETGRLAASAITEGIRPADVRARYSALLDRHFVADHRMSSVLSGLLAGRRTTELALRIVDTSDWTRRNFARWMFEDEPRAGVFTPRRWHKGFLSRPGAYRSAGLH
jgi:flavin-dependent dehydrogenase